MIGRKAIVGLLLLSALVFCALSAPGAWAKESTNTTFYTCVAEPLKKGDFIDSHCDTVSAKKEGGFTHSAAVALKTKTEVAATNTTSAVLKGTLLKAKTQITCTVAKNKTAESTIENLEPEAKVHKISGTIVTEFSKCTVNLPAKCVVNEPITSRATITGVDALKGPDRFKVPPEGELADTEAMGIEFKGEIENAAKEKEIFTEIRFPSEAENPANKECALKGNTFTVKGSVVATSGPGTEETQNRKNGGSTLVFTPKFEMQKLTLGGNAAEFEVITTATNATSGNPITTTTPTAP